MLWISKTCCDLDLLCWALFIALIACLSFVNLLTTFVFEMLPSMKMDSGFITSGSMQESLTYKGSNGSENWCMNMWDIHFQLCMFCSQTLLGVI